MAGIRDVARLAHVSTSTVSLVLNKSGYVSDKTREKVETAMRELNYIPNELARNLYHSKTNIVGLILPDIAHPFFGSFAKYAEMELYKEGYKTMLCSTVHEENGEKEYIDMLNRQMMDGIIMGTHSLDIEDYNGVVRPIVSLDRYINESIPIVMSDHEKGGTLAAEELLRCGCKKVLQIMGSRNVNTPAHLHHYAFEKKLLEAGVTVCTEESNRFDTERNSLSKGHLMKQNDHTRKEGKYEKENYKYDTCISNGIYDSLWMRKRSGTEYGKWRNNGSGK